MIKEAKVTWVAQGKLLTGFSLICVAMALVELWPQSEKWLATISSFTTVVTASLIEFSGMDVVRQGTWLDHSSGFGLDIGLGCTALLPIAVIVVFMLAAEQSKRSMMAGVLFGCVFALSLNFLRLTALFIVGVKQPQWLDWVHLVGQLLLTVFTGSFLLVWTRRPKRLPI